MKNLNNYVLIVCAFLLLMICILSVSGTMNNHDDAEDDSANGAVYNQNN